MQNKQIIDVSEKESVISFRPLSFLGPGRFADYRQALKGCKYNPETKRMTCHFMHLHDIISSLKKADFNISIDKDLFSRYDDFVKKHYDNFEKSRDRIEIISEKLSERGLSLFPFQRTGVRWLSSRRAALLSDEMGLGKTIQAITAIPDGASVVIVCPASVKGVWQAEFEKWRPEFSVTVLKGRQQDFQFPFEPNTVVIMNYDILPSGFTTMPSENSVVIADEAHALKSWKSLRTKRFTELAGTVAKAGGYVYLLTATPLLNKPSDLWSILECANIAREAFTSFKEYQSLFGARKDKWGGTTWGHPDPRVPDMLSKVCLRRSREEVLPDLPTKIYKDIVVDVKSFIGEDIELDVSRHILNNTMPDFEEIATCRAQLAELKIPAMMEIIEDFEAQDEPLVVCSSHRAPIDKFIDRPGWRVITGDTPVEKRTLYVAEFQEGKLLGIAGTIPAMGVGITLTRSNIVLFVDLDWTPALNAQMEDRVCRIGQKRGVIIVRLLTNNALDSRVNDLLINKQILINASIDEVIGMDHTVHVPNGIELTYDAIAAKANYDVVKPQKFYEPATPKESWTLEALLQLVNNDTDKASAQNGVGFNKLDSTLGHALYNFYRINGGLSLGQWKLAFSMVQKYKKQVGVFSE